MAALMLFALAAPAAAVPPPPPPPAIEGKLDLLRRSYEVHDLARYESLLADNVSVVRNRDIIARSKEEWLTKFRPQLLQSTIRVDRVAASFRGVLTAETIDTRAFKGDRVADCCFWARTVYYKFDNPA